MNSPWLPFIYQYSICTLFFIAVTVIALRKNVISLHHPAQRRVLVEIILGYLFFISLHASMIIVSGA